ncbi:MAG: hypothetical protein WDO24_22180 [Pseudomonadota bacterium]
MNNQIDGTARLENLQRSLGILGLLDMVAELLELARHDAPHRRLVLDHEDSLAVSPWQRLCGVPFDDFVRRPIAWEIESEGRAHAKLAVDADMAAGLLDESEHHAETQPGALADRLGGEERLEDLGQRLGRDTDSRVADLQHRVVAGFDLGVGCRIVGIEVLILGRDAQAAALPHRVAGVGREIDQRRFELAGIHDDRPDAGSKAQRDLDLLTQRPAQQRGGVPNQVVEIDIDRSERLAAGKGEQAARQIGAAPSGSLRLVDEFLEVRIVAAALAQQPQIPDDDAQQVVEVVRHAAGQLADRFHFLRLDELGLGGLAGGDVENDHHARRALLEHDGVREGFDVDQAAILVAMAEVDAMLPLWCPTDSLLRPRDILRGQNLRQLQGEKFRARIAVCRDRDIVDGQKGQALRIEDPYRQRAALEQIAEALLAAPTPLLRGAQRADDLVGLVQTGAHRRRRQIGAAAGGELPATRRSAR